MKNILICLEDNSRSVKVAEKGILLARELNASISLLHIIDESSFSDDDELVRDFITFRRRKIKNFVQKLIKKFDVAVFAYIEEGNSEKIIIDKANSINPEVIVFGTYHRNESKKLFREYLVRELINYSEFPVLIISN